MFAHEKNYIKMKPLPEWCTVWGSECRFCRIQKSHDEPHSSVWELWKGKTGRSKIFRFWVLGFEFWWKVGHFGVWILSSKLKFFFHVDFRFSTQELVRSDQFRFVLSKTLPEAKLLDRWMCSKTMDIWEKLLFFFQKSFLQTRRSKSFGFWILSFEFW